MSTEKKTNIAKALAAQLHVTEEAIDTALAEAANYSSVAPVEEIIAAE